MTPLSWVYAAAMNRRNRRYDRRDLRANDPGIPVVSIGNITTGGTGKTPIVMLIARRAIERGMRPVILTRGYGAPPGRQSDEVLEYGVALRDVPVVVNPDRVAAAREARDAHGADCVVLDDGFQHRRLPRTLDLVVIDALDPWGAGCVLPAGRLREPLRGLSRADVFVVSRCNQVGEAAVDGIDARLRELNAEAPIAHADVSASALVRQSGEREAPDALGFSCVLPVCGVGNPATFLRSVELLAGCVASPLVYRDHCRYGAKLCDRIAAWARRAGADVVVTTRKDWVKLSPMWRDRKPQLTRLDVEMRLRTADDRFEAALERGLGRGRVLKTVNPTGLTSS